MHPAKQDRMFGIELEVSRSLLNVINSEREKHVRWTNLEKKLRQMQFDKSIRNGWQLHPDRSCGGEIVSPPMRIADGAYKDIVKVCQMVNEMAIEAGLPSADGECGLHIHFDAADIKARNLAAIFSILYHIEPLIYTIYPDRNADFCAPLSINMARASSFRTMLDVRDAWYRQSNNLKEKRDYDNKFINSQQPGEKYDGTRYHGFNIHCLWRIGTIEFRYARGTFDPVKIFAFHELCAGVVEAALKKRKIPIIDSQKDFSTLRAEMVDSYKFRGNFIKMCKSLGLSRSAISALITVIRDENPSILNKNPAKMIRWVCESNKLDYVFTSLFGNFNANGELVKNTAVAKKSKFSIPVNIPFGEKIKVEYPDNVRIEAEIKIPDEIKQRFERKEVQSIGAGGIRFIA